MPSAFPAFAAAVRALAPTPAVVLGSGLAGVTADFRERASVSFGDIPGLVPPTVPGHTGRLAVGEWAGTPALVFFGRLHVYEGHPWAAVTGPVRVLADLGANRLLLTNAAGGIHPSLGPGSLMAIRDHVTLLDRDAWRELTAGERRPSPYSPRLVRVLQDNEAAAGRELLAGVYAALTGPSYETPAEIRALRTSGADAVGMSTAREAEAAAALGLEVAAVSCITNKAAGLGGAPLDHREVLANAKLAAGRLGLLLASAIRAA
jgi:purine-nucleoside phosphorylase